jgi:riboflavin synthase
MGRVAKKDGLRLEIAARLARARVGDSIAVDGVCLTVVKAGGGRVAFDLSQETIDRTTIGGWAPGRPVNIEPALRAGDAMGGHIVQGHVDGVGRVLGREPKGDWSLYTFSIPKGMGDYFVSKGSVAVDGISLTILKPGRGKFQVAIIPHTEKVTTLGGARVGAWVNIEADILAKQVTQLMRNWNNRRGLVISPSARGRGGVVGGATGMDIRHPPSSPSPSGGEGIPRILRGEGSAPWDIAPGRRK